MIALVLRMRVPHAGLRLAAPVSAAMAAVLAATDFPLTVGRVVTGSNASVQLTNVGHQPITAWSLATTSLSVDRTHRDIQTVDGYLNEVTGGFPGSSHRLDRLLPSQARAIALDPLPPDATVDVVAVVLDDGTAI